MSNDDPDHFPVSIYKGLYAITVFLYHEIFVIRAKHPELQIRGGIEDNSKIIFLISQQKHML